MISAIILAAGQSKRMGQPKMLLPWGDKTVLGNVIVTFREAGLQDILVVTGGDRERVDALVGGSARTVYNSEFSRGEMLRSVQVGMAEFTPETEAMLIALGDQPQVQAESVRAVIEGYRESKATIVIPSFQMRRGHPWLIDKKHWIEIQQMKSPRTLRDFINTHANEIYYVSVGDNSILQDLDTPEDYLKSKP